ncbi:Hypothetical protein, putative [Bodo saltans]|uniref:Membrane-associated protein n=1 Tax=Bodo saltans TaxID=75058 RepID=A0A0S4JQV1_BODSA|nr:Hypothetical protein, putative [Bodo saltans]|eukprot:CUG92926.1 Hypothetical protein, putative [Bodo saltans]
MVLLIALALLSDNLPSYNVTFGTPHSADVCDHLRTALRGNTTAAWSRRLLPHVYQIVGLLPPNSRLVLSMTVPSSGFGLCNVRSFVLDHLVLAALVGADVVLQNADTLDRPGSEPIAHQLEGYFDLQHLRAEWKRFCPSMVLYHDRRSEGSHGPFLEELERERGVLVARQSKTVVVGSTRTDEDAIQNNVEKRLSEMDADIRPLLTAATELRHAKRKKWNAATYVVIPIKKFHMCDWSLPLEAGASLGELRRAVGASLRSPKYITRVAARVVEHLKALGEESGNGQQFCGAHLRSEPDMTKVAGHRADGTKLTDLFLEAVVAAGTKQCGLVYVAAGTEADLDRFSTLALAHNITLVTLSSLSKTTTLMTDAARWSYSQKAVLEYEILAASHKFVGASTSSFSWNLAIRRYFAQSTDTLPLRHIIQPFQSTTYHDALSTLYLGIHTDASQPLIMGSLENKAPRGMLP